MNLETLVGKTFKEDEFYNLLLEEIEDHFDQHRRQPMCFYFDRIENEKIKITSLEYFENLQDLDQKGRQIIEKKEWIQLYESEERNILLLVRFDRTGTLSIIRQDSTHSEPWEHGWYDEEPGWDSPLTAEEMRQGFLEMMGLFQESQEATELKFKKSM